MTISEIKQKINANEYSYLKTDPHLGDRIILLGHGGSHAYGTAVEGSDIDLRGCALNSKCASKRDAYTWICSDMGSSSGSDRAWRS